MKKCNQDRFIKIQLISLSKQRLILNDEYNAVIEVNILMRKKDVEKYSNKEITIKELISIMNNRE